MNKSTHTPGPWSYVDNVGFYSNGAPFADPYFGNGEGDIRLICAAPDLLAFCEKLKRNGGFYGSSIELNVHEGDKLDGYELLKELDELIKKATAP